MQELIKVQDSIYKLSEKADATALDLVTLFSTQADALILELQETYEEENKANSKAQEWQKTLADTFALQADALIEELKETYNKENELEEKSKQTQKNLVDTFNLEAETLINELQKIYEKEEKEDLLTKEWQKNLADTFALKTEALIKELQATYDKENEANLKAKELQKTLADTFALQSSALINELQATYIAENDADWKANQLQNSLAWAFSTKSNNLLNELLASYNSLENANTMTNLLKGSLDSALKGSYDTSGITSSIDKITSAARDAKSALDNLGGNYIPNTIETNEPQIPTAQKPSQENNTKDTTVVYVDKSGNKNNFTGKSNQVLKDAGLKIEARAKGGTITKENHGSLDFIAEVVGEDKLIAVNNGESVLTEKQTDLLRKFAENWNPNNFLANMQPMYTLPKMPEIAPRNASASVLEFNGTLMHIDKVDSTNIKQMETIANKAVNKLVDRINNGMRY